MKDNNKADPLSPTAEQSEFIDQGETVSRLTRLIDEATQKIWLVSPYVCSALQK